MYVHVCTDTHVCVCTCMCRLTAFVSTSIPPHYTYISRLADQCALRTLLSSSPLYWH